MVKKHFSGLDKVVAIFLLLLLVKLSVIVQSEGPKVFADELLYKQDAHLLFNIKPFTNSAYPPLYALLLSPAYVFGSSWYHAMLIINCIISSSVIFPIFMITKKIIPEKLQLFSLLLTTLLPYHFIYPVYLLAENASLPLFLWLIYLTLFISPNRNRSGFMFGIVAALLYLTKFLFLPIILLSLVMWTTRSIYIFKYKTDAFNRKSFFSLVVPLLGFIITYLPWIVFSSYSGFSIRETFGLSIEENIHNVANLNSLIVWTVLYLSYFVLSVWPFMFNFAPSILLYLRNRNAVNNQEKIYYLSLALFTMFFLMVAIRHSWGVYYNYPSPNYIIGRYLLYLTPLYVLAFVNSVYHATRRKKYLAGSKVLIIWVISLVPLPLSYLILFQGLIWDLPKWFATIPFNSIDIFYLNLINIKYLLLVIIVSFGLFKLVTSQNVSVKLFNNRNIIFFLVITLIFYMWVSWKAYEISSNSSDNQRARHGLEVARLSTKFRLNDKSPAYIYYLELKNVSLSYLSNSVKFWVNEPYFRMSMINSPDEIIRVTDGHMILVTSGELKYKVLTQYKVANTSYYVYSLE